ncbi:MAG TPA: O-antigen ligase family protein [Stellaceae bacterium]|nr:O-antigen ligase family protein [Stellaceae bacterium]
MAALVWAPLWYGGNDRLAFGVDAIVFPALAAAHEILQVGHERATPRAFQGVAIPAALFFAVVLWILFQMSHGAPAPFVNPIWGITEEALGRGIVGSISVDPELTARALVRLLTDASVFWLALRLGRERSAALVAGVAAIGCAYAAYGLVAAAFPEFPRLPHTAFDRGYVASTFVNRNDYAAYAGVGLIAMVALLSGHCRVHIAGVAPMRARLGAAIEASVGRGAALVGGCWLMLAALLLTGSRGGIIASGAGLMVFALMRRRRSARSSLPWAIGLIVIAVAVWVFGGVVGGKLAEGGVSDANRLAVYDLTLQSIRDRPLLGWGYGTFRDVFPMYRDRSISVLGTWSEAHNTYLEVLQGLGLVFGPLLILCVALPAFRCVQRARRRRDELAPAVAAGAAALIGTHSMIDFSVQIPAVAITFMTLLGAGAAEWHDGE